MQIVKQLFLFMLACFLGEWVSKLLPVAFPASILAMIFMSLFLLLRAVKEKDVDTVGDFFLQHMSLFFIPSSVNLLEHFAMLKETFLPFLLICFITLLLTFTSTAYTVMAVRKLQEKVRERRKHS